MISKLFVFTILMFLIILGIIFISFEFINGTQSIKISIIVGGLVIHANYFLLYTLRSIFVLGYYSWKNLLFPPDVSKVLLEHFSSHVVLLSDSDVFLHMNNAQYRKAMDFARLSYFGNSGLMQYNMKHGTFAFMVAACGRYRQSLNLFQKYQIGTKLVYWDEHKLYFQQRFLANYKDQKNFVYSTNIVALKVNKENPETLLTNLLGYRPQPLSPSAELESFIKYNEESSQNLKKNI